MKFLSCSLFLAVLMLLVQSCAKEEEDPCKDAVAEDCSGGSWFNNTATGDCECFCDDPDAFYSPTEGGCITHPCAGFLDCGINGYCTSIDNQAVCVCNDGWTGPNCDIPIVDPLSLSVQAALDLGVTPKGILTKYPKDSLYGKVYQGDFIFHIEDNGSGMVAAAEDQDINSLWGDVGDLSLNDVQSDAPQGTETEDGARIWDGMSNTQIILDEITAVDSSAAFRARTRGEEWFLPSRGELNLMFKHLADADGDGMSTGLDDPGNIGGFALDWYWSSTEHSFDQAWHQTFRDGTIATFANNKEYYEHVRAARAFCLDGDCPLFDPAKVQDALGAGITPKTLFDYGTPLDSLYGKMYQGGLIFYLNNEDGSGMVVANTDQSTGTSATWGCIGTDIMNLNNVPWNGGVPQGSGAEIGDGKANTDAIIAGCMPNDEIAAKLCRDLGEDWFLPSIKELGLMYTNLYEKGHGEFASDFDFYYSSTEVDGEDAWLQAFLDGGQVVDDKDNLMVNLHVRAARGF